MFKVFLLISKDNKLALRSIRATRVEAERDLVKEFPEGCVIWDGYRIIEAELKIS